MLIVIVLLAACGPTSAQIQQTVQMRMAQTEAARPTATFTPIPIATRTMTPTATPTVTQTNTLLPTFTPMPTQTEVPKVALRKLLITITDFANMSDFYYPNPIVSDEPNTGGYVIVSTSETFQGKETAFGTVTISLYRYQDAITAKEINDGLKLGAPPFDVSFSVPVPDNFWVGADLVGNLFASATYKEILINLQIEAKPGMTARDMSSFALLLIKIR